MHAYSWVVTDVQTERAIPTAVEMTAACLSMESILDDPRQERVGWYVIGGRWSQRLAPELADSTPLPHDMQNEWWKDVPGNVTVVRQLDPDERGLAGRDLYPDRTVEFDAPYLRYFPSAGPRQNTPRPRVIDQISQPYHHGY